MEPLMIVGAVLALFVLVLLVKTVRIVPQARSGVLERLGRYQRTLEAGLNIVIPFVDRVRPLIDMREQVVSFPPQPVITEDNLVVEIDSVIYFQVTDARAASYEIEDYIRGVEQLTVTTLRNVVGGMDLERTLTSREEINMALRGVLDSATGRWGLRVNRVELKSIEPPPSVKDSMEKQMRAERDKRAAILTAEGAKQSAILNAQGYKESAVLSAEGQKQAEILKADGEAAAIRRVFDSINSSDANDRVLAYQYLQALPEIANGSASKIWVLPAEVTQAMGSLSNAFRSPAAGDEVPPTRADQDGQAQRPAAQSPAVEQRPDDD